MYDLTTNEYIPKAQRPSWQAEDGDEAYELSREE